MNLNEFFKFFNTMDLPLEKATTFGIAAPLHPSPSTFPILLNNEKYYARKMHLEMNEAEF